MILCALLLAASFFTPLTGGCDSMRWRLEGTAYGGWQVAPSLEKLLEQVDAEWPAKHGADGTLGNDDHATRNSDHNPDDDTGMVRAGDIGEVTEDDAFELAFALNLSEDPRIKYVIHENGIFFGSGYEYLRDRDPYVWYTYTGSNGHWSHVHVSVLESNEEDDSPWDIGVEVNILTDEQQQDLVDFLDRIEAMDSSVAFVVQAIEDIREKNADGNDYAAADHTHDPVDIPGVVQPHDHVFTGGKVGRVASTGGA